MDLHLKGETRVAFLARPRSALTIGINMLVDDELTQSINNWKYDIDL